MLTYTLFGFKTSVTLRKTEVQRQHTSKLAKKMDGFTTPRLF
jgi:hypothetical protein